MTDEVRQVLDAVDRRDWPRLRLLLHPYLHWTEAGRTVRGRTKVLALLQARPVLDRPESVELRDGLMITTSFASWTSRFWARITCIRAARLNPKAC